MLNPLPGTPVLMESQVSFKARFRRHLIQEECRLPSRNLSRSALAVGALGVYPQTAPLWCGMVHPLFPMGCELPKSSTMSDLPWRPLAPGALGLA